MPLPPDDSAPFSACDSQGIADGNAGPAATVNGNKVVDLDAAARQSGSSNGLGGTLLQPVHLRP
jgi:hypothetical protein